MEPKIRCVIQDGEPVWKATCPWCGREQELDDDMLHGRASTQCSYDDCDFHQWVDWTKYIVPSAGSQ